MAISIADTTLILPTSACYYLELCNAMIIR